MGHDVQSNANNIQASRGGLARHIPMSKEFSGRPEGVIIPDAIDDEDLIAVIYDSRDAPPEITISATAGHVQIVMANGVAVAIVACADGPRLRVDDILLVERIVS